MAKTNIDIDDELVERAMQLYSVRTRREIVDLALRRLVGDGPMSVDDQLALRGMGWDADLDEMRADRSPDWSNRAAR